MKLPQEGGCACGAIRFEVTAEPARTFQCHCYDCQKITGGPFIAAAIFPKKAFRFTKGAPTYYSSESAMGGVNTRGFCAVCGSRITGGERGGDWPWIGVTVSSFDDRGWYRPQFHCFTAHAQDWDRIGDDIPSYRHYAPRPAPTEPTSEA